jgi:hypothetical protein
MSIFMYKCITYDINYICYNEYKEYKKVFDNLVANGYCRVLKNQSNN